jgi:hypothetical protein
MSLWWMIENCLIFDELCFDFSFLMRDFMQTVNYDNFLKSIYIKKIQFKIIKKN